MDLRDIAIFNIKSADYCCVISGVSESETIKLMQNIDLTGKSETSLNPKFFIDIKSKPLYIMHPKTSTYLKRYHGQTK